MAQASKTSAQIVLGKFLVESLSNTDVPLPNTVLEEKAVELGFAGENVINNLKKFYKDGILWKDETFSLEPTSGIDGLLFQVNIYRKKVNLEPITEAELQKPGRERK